MTHLREVMTARVKRSLDCAWPRDRVAIINNRIGYGLRNLIGALHLAKAFHPELMTDIDPPDPHREMLDRFFNMELDGVLLLSMTAILVQFRQFHALAALLAVVVGLILAGCISGLVRIRLKTAVEAPSGPG